MASVASLAAYGVAFYMANLSLRQSRTSATLVLSAVGLWVLVCLARPFNWWRTVLVAAMVGSIAVILFVPALRNFYALQVPDADVVAEMVVIGAIAVVAIEVVWRVTQRTITRRNPEYAAAAADI